MREVKPEVITVNAKPGRWTLRIWEMWDTEVAPLFKDGDTCSTANYFTERPYRNEYDQGSDKEGFTYVVQPGNRVCFWERIVGRKV